MSSIFSKYFFMRRTYFLQGLKILAVFIFLLPTKYSLCQVPPVPQNIYDLYNEVLKYVDNVPKETDLHPAVPPSTYYDYCFPCDKERQAVFIRDSIAFMDGYMGEEVRYMKKANTVMDYFNDKRVKKQKFDSLTFLKMSPNMFRAKIVIAQRMQVKLTAAWKEYYNIPEKVPFLVRRMLEQYRTNALVGVQEKSGMPSVNILPQLLVNAAAKRLAEATKERDYRILLNIDWIMQLFHSAAALGITENLPFNFSDYEKSNQFLFTIETKAKVIGGDKTTFSTSLTSKPVFVATPDENCRLKWSLETQHLRFRYHLDDIAIESPASAKFVGSRDYDSRAPQVKLDFCEDGRDTVHFYGFQCSTGIEQWIIDGAETQTAVVLSTYIIAFPDTRPFEEFIRGGANARAQTIPFGFYIKQQPRNKEKVIVEQTINSKDVSKYAQYVKYGEFKLKIEHVE